ncbi:response regulator transcription factor [Sinanaerobacter sp. ZZT-01]|uniref:response regulator transcription factor n=1 Tax=Sinanaerobacter sp. ZZT-01 TaxID=3111540 RepID=UPI002D774774|nr:response regulator transcription factor [Sinanaerobacter sp. ZZT-01]WRR94306.1 response regulator transcription factor [Sinanaerobacter sp. ZZT-01]
MQKILMIEDEPNIRELVSYHLIQNNYEPLMAEDGTEGLRMAREEFPDLILLDIMLPEKNGYDICKDLRAEGNKTPIIMLTAKSDEVDKILGLEFGADDYLAKPFSPRELMARIKAVLRRYSQKDREDKIKEQTKSERIIVDSLIIDKLRHEVELDGEIISLTLKEFDLLLTLAESPGRVFTRDQLLDRVWGFEYVGETRTVDVHIRYLRKKLKDDERTGKYIQTVRGIGYKMPERNTKKQQ